jgi:hypothetical protein
MPLRKEGSRSGNSDKNLVRFAHNWNDGVVEGWNNGFGKLEQLFIEIISLTKS